VFWAIELGQWAQVKTLLTTSHGMKPDLVEKLLSGAFAPIQKSPSAFPGERTFEVCRSLLVDDAKMVSEGKQTARGAFALLRPFCASVTALRYFQKHEDHYAWLREACARANEHIYKAIDEQVGSATLERLALVGMEENQHSIRQDGPGLLPEMKYFKDENKKWEIAGNPEVFVARSLALLALAFNEVFLADIRKVMTAHLARDAFVHMVEPAPKNFRRMYNKLMNFAEHGDPSLEKPRPAKNVDVSRCCIGVTDPNDVEIIFRELKKRYKILRVKNSHSPSQQSYCYRSVLVNFAYDPGVTWRELMGDTGGYDAPSDSFHARDPKSEVWLNYCQALTPSWDWSWGLEGLFRAARIEPHRTVCWSAELQIIIDPYMRGRLLSHLLYKIARCETGPAEMARDFAGSFQEETRVMKATRGSLLKMVSSLRASNLEAISTPADMDRRASF